MINPKSLEHDRFSLPAVTPPTLVPATISPIGKIFSNHSTWSIQVNRQVIL
jgi:hypothetical protein